MAPIVVAAAVPVAMLGTGGAAADDYSGETYAAASGAISSAGDKSKIESKDGDALPDDQCLVMRSEQAPWIKGDDFQLVANMVLLDLNCNARVASANGPGNSAASPHGHVIGP